MSDRIQPLMKSLELRPRRGTHRTSIVCGNRRAAGRGCRRTRGYGLAETMVALPLVIMLGLGAAQWGLIYHAKATVDHATLMAARFGAVRNADPQAIQAGLNQGMLPLFSPDRDLDQVNDWLAQGGRIQQEMAQWSAVTVLNPDQAAFDDFGEMRNGTMQIPNDGLSNRDTARGDQSDINIQDANVLKIRVVYGYRMWMPFVGGLIADAASWGGWIDQAGNFTGLQQQMLQNNRLPIVSSAAVRMQSPAEMSGAVAGGP